MKIKSAKATNLHGYLNHEIFFNPDLTFLTGMNGSGKTSMLKVIQAILQPSFYLLKTLEYENITLICELDNDEIVFDARKSGDSCTLSISGVGILGLRNIADTQIDDTRRLSISEQYNVEIARENENNDVIKWFRHNPPPIILGIDRKRFDTLSRPRSPINPRGVSYSHTQSLSIGVRDAISLIDRALREYTIEKDLKDERFKRDLMNESIKSLLVTQKSIEESYRFTVEEIDERAEKIRSALNSILSKESLFDNALDEFVKAYHIDKNVTDKNEDKEENKDAYIKSLLNLPVYSLNFSKLESLIKIIEEHKIAISNLYSKIEGFFDAINTFLADSRKSLYLGSRGSVLVRIRDKDSQPLSVLSSGETQLLVMLANISLTTDKERSQMFIIDEPELSLHIKWQESFVDAIRKSNRDIQLILATHAPSIILNRTEFCFDMEHGA
jgi:predicted ATP-binding protein involved in virulence